MKYLVLKSWNDYDCGAPCASIVNNSTYDTWEKAYDAMVDDIKKTYEVNTLDELSELKYDYEIPPRENVGGYTHKCATAWIYDEDSEKLWDITAINA